jgi:hypothetical protein
MSSPTTIVKVQRPIMPADGPWLVYDQTRRRERLIDTPNPSVLAAMSGDLKAYFRATWTGTAWVIRERVADQPW